MSNRIVGIRGPIKTSVVYESYWNFAAERQRIFFRRLDNTRPFTTDPVLSMFRFTNAYRASDRVSQYLIRHVIYQGAPGFNEVFFRTILFRLFNKIKTWELLLKRLDEIAWQTFSFAKYDEILTHALAARETIYSAAYIMPSRAKEFTSPRKHRNHLQLLVKLMLERVPERLATLRRASEAFALLRSYPMIGDFLAYQFLTDLNYGPLLNFSEMEFVIPGPGAKSGLRKCFLDAGGLSDADLIRLVTESQELEFQRRSIVFDSLWGRPLQLIDCQNLFCEIDKYSRIVHPEFNGQSGRTRIKQIYRSNPEPMMLWYPPKWGINDMIVRDRISQ